MQIVFLITVWFVFSALAETSQTETLLTNIQETVNVKKEKFSFLLNLLKSAITDENNKNTENLNLIREPDTESIINQSEIELKELQNDPENNKIENKDLKIENDAVLDKTFDKILTKISTAIENKQKNNTQLINVPKNTEMPSMIPIFKPKNANMASKSNQISSQLKNNFDSEAANFNIPCHRAAEVLEFSTQTLNNIHGNFAPAANVISKNISCQESPVNPNIRYGNIASFTNVISNKTPCKENPINSKTIQEYVAPIYKTISKNIPSQEHSVIPKNVQRNIAPITKKLSNIVPSKEKSVISVDSKDVDESVKMLFKPKNISLMQLYGNLLKKITITVLVPYHISKMNS